MAVWEPSSSNLPTLNERPISSVKWNATITEIYEKLNMLKSSSTSAGIPPVEPSTGQIWWDTGDAVVKVWDGTVWGNLANESFAVPVVREIITSAPLQGGGVLSADLSLSILTATSERMGVVQYATLAEMSSGVRTDRAVSPSGLQSLIDSTHVPSASPANALKYARINVDGNAYETFLPVITAGNGLTGGGALSDNRTVTLGAPSTITSATTNSVTTTSHTHAINAETSNVAGSIVGRDASGNFSAGTITATINGNVTGNITGNADTATKLAATRSISLTGGVTGSTTFDGSGNSAIAATVTNNSHTHTSANISDATNANTGNTLVKRDASGNFSAGTISAALTGNVTGNADTATNATNAAYATNAGNAATATNAAYATNAGNASTATALQTTRYINGVAFNGTGNITVADDTKLPLSGGTMTGVLYPQNNTSYTTGQARRIILSTSDASGGSNGDVWLKYA